VLLTITTTHRPADDLGYLLHKNPARCQSFPLSFGAAHVFYPEVSPDRCTAALLLDVDPVGLVRQRRGPSGEGGLLDQYVNDRPYVASSFLSVAIAQVFGSALSGRCKDRPDVVSRPLPLTARLAAVPCRGGEDLLRRLFEPLGYAVAAERHPLDPRFPDWGDSPYYTVTLSATLTLRSLLSHLYVLIPVLDNDKHYWVDRKEVDKLLRQGEGWLAEHPERELITARYLRYQRRLTDEALERLGEDDPTDPDEAARAHDAEEAAVERPLSLHEQRLGTVLSVLKGAGARSVLDLGCGEGRLIIQHLLKEPQFERILGVDVSARSLRIAADRLRYDRMPERQRERVKLIHGSLMYRDRRLEGFDAAAVVEVIEHMDAPRLAAFERVVFEFARPRTVVVSTPNAEYNVMWPTLPAGRFRHRDHRFEWTRAQFAAWCETVCARFGYSVRIAPIGPEGDGGVGSPTQMGVFTRSPAP
jgi:3' terminal RNA ribose 2'-O-methyltransferase Hen1